MKQLISILLACIIQWADKHHFERFTSQIKLIILHLRCHLRQTKTIIHFPIRKLLTPTQKNNGFFNLLVFSIKVLSILVVMDQEYRVSPLLCTSWVLQELIKGANCTRLRIALQGEGNLEKNSVNSSVRGIVGQNLFSKSFMSSNELSVSITYIFCLELKYSLKHVYLMVS